MLEADGSLRYEADPNIGPNTVPPLVRRLDRSQMARLWDAAARLGLTDPAHADRTADLRRVKKPDSRGRIWMLVITGEGDRWNFTRRAEGDEKPDAAIVSFGRQLASLAWAADGSAHVVSTEPERWNYGADPWAPWRGQDSPPPQVAKAVVEAPPLVAGSSKGADSQPAPEVSVVEVRLPPPSEAAIPLVELQPAEIPSEIQENAAPPARPSEVASAAHASGWPIDFGRVKVEWGMAHQDLPTEVGCDAWEVPLVLRARHFKEPAEGTTEPPMSIAEINVLGGGVLSRRMVEIMKEALRTCAEASGLLGATVDARLRHSPVDGTGSELLLLVSVPLEGATVRDLKDGVVPLPGDSGQ